MNFSVFSGFPGLMLALLVASLMQNLVLTTGFGISVLLRIVRRPREIATYGLLLTIFAVLTTIICYHFDMATAKMVLIHEYVRPVVEIAVVALLYMLVRLFLSKFRPLLYARVQRLLPLAAFNNVVVGLALAFNYKVAMNLLQVVGFTVGSCIGFVLLSALTAEGVERLDNPDMPKAFRGIPSMLLYLGILALALMGFQPLYNLI